MNERKLTDEQKVVLLNKGTEAPFTGKYVDFEGEGMYKCVACGNPLFNSDSKFYSGSGWPSFTDVAKEGNVKLVDDNSHGMRRSEVVCNKCGGHLGHLFDDGPVERGGKRFCINSCALEFENSKK